MTAIIVAIGTVISLYAFEPLWFDTRMHYLHQTYENDKACSLAAHQQKDVTGRVCIPKDDFSGHVDLYLTKD
jgi:hypothetical protein